MGTYLAGTGRLSGRRRELVRSGRVARWAGKSLPTIYHWSRAADQRLSADVVPASNFSGKSLLPGWRVGRHHPRRHDRHGWQCERVVLNATGSKRYILGGAWNEPVYMFTDSGCAVAVCAPRDHGFRCIKVDRPEDLSPALTAIIEYSVSRSSEYETRQRGGFRGVAQPAYSFDHGDLNAKVESVDDSSP